MTARSLTGNFSNFGAYFLHKLQSLRSMIILNSIFALLSYPLIMVTVLPYANAETKLGRMEKLNLDNTAAYDALVQQSDMLESLMGAAVFIAVMMLAAMFIMNYVICSKSFRWLYKKSIVDMDYSLPVSDDTRFFGDLLASLTGSLVPHFLAILIASGLYWCMPFEAMGAEKGEPAIVFNVIQQLAYTGMFSCVMFMGFCLLVMSLCGRVVEARIMPFVANAAIPAIHALCLVLILNNMFGYDSGGDFEYSGLAVSSPIGLLIMTVVSIANGYYTIEDENFRVIMLRPDILVPLLIVTIGSFVLAYVLIRFRRAERVGSPYVYPGARLVFPGMVIFTLVSAFMLVILEEMSYGYDFADKLNNLADMSGVMVAMVILSFIIYVIMELISGKGFKKFHLTLARYGGTLGICVLLCILLHSVDVVGLERYTPDADNVEWAQLYLIENYNNDSDSCWQAEVTDAESIAAIVDYHKSLPKFGDEEYNDNWISVDYHLKSGSTLCRRYYLTREQYLEAVATVVTPEVHFYDNFENNMGYLSYEDEDRECRVTEVYTSVGLEPTDFSLNELAEAFRADCENLTTPLLYGDTSVDMERLTLRIEVTYNADDVTESYSYDNYENFTVYSWYENTVKLLEDEGVQLFDDNIAQCTTAFAVKIPYNEYYDSGYLNARTLMIASVADKLNAEQMDNYGYYVDQVYYDYYNEYYTSYVEGYSSAPPAIDTPMYFADVIPSYWELYTMEADGRKAQKLLSMSSDILPLDYSKPYDTKDHVIVLLFTDASEDTMNHETGEVKYQYEILRFITPENLATADRILQSLE